MLERFRRKKVSILDEPIERILSDMNVYGPDTDEYPRLIDNLERLIRLKEFRNRVTPDTMAIVAGNLLGILVIVVYEQKHVMVSKGLGFILNPRGSRIGT